MFRDKIYESHKELGIELKKAGLIKKDNRTRPEQSVSAYIKQATDLELPYFRIHNEIDLEHIFFAEYEIIEQGNIRLDETPIRSSLEEYKAEYLTLLDLEFGDITLGDLLWSKSKKFYKIEDMYYKSKVNILKDFTFDKKIDKKTAIRLIENRDCFIEKGYDINDIKTSAKKFYYLKDTIVYKNKNSFAENKMIEMSKEDILSEIGMLL